MMALDAASMIDFIQDINGHHCNMSENVRKKQYIISPQHRGGKLWMTYRFSSFYIGLKLITLWPCTTHFLARHQDMTFNQSQFRWLWAVTKLEALHKIQWASADLGCKSSPSTVSYTLIAYIKDYCEGYLESFHIEATWQHSISVCESPLYE